MHASVCVGVCFQSLGHLPKTGIARTSLVVRRLRIHLPMQGTQVQALVWEGPTCHGATKPVSHNY